MFEKREHPRALTMALLIHAECLRRSGAAVGSPDVETHLVIERYLGEWPEEKRASLYSYLCESLTRGDTFMNIRMECDKALKRVDWTPHG
jgi:hypothetical protein